MKKKICTLLVLGLCSFSISACKNKELFNNFGNVLTSSQIEETSEKSSDTTTEDIETKANKETKENKGNEELVDGMRPEFKEAMDSYEEFYDEYCDIIKKYSKNPSDMKLLSEYTNMLTKASKMEKKFDAWKNNDMNNEELKYYLEVNNRITKKILEVSE